MLKVIDSTRVLFWWALVVLFAWAPLRTLVTDSPDAETLGLLITGGSTGARPAAVIWHGLVARMGVAIVLAWIALRPRR